MELLIWRWSTVVQLTSLVMIAVFFAALTRSVQVARLGWWVLAWTSNLAALAVAVSFWFLQPESPLGVVLLRGLYMGAKTAFVVFLIQGAWALKRPGTQLVRTPAAAAGIVIYAILGGLLVSGVDLLGVVQQGALGILFGLGTLLLLRGPLEGSMTWLVAGFALRSLLSFVESAAYAVALFPAGTFSEGLTVRAAIFTAAHSFLDSGTEWLTALGCVLALSERTQRELREYNTALLEAQEGLRRMADRDPLTALANRRILPAVLRSAQPAGATVLFFDLDDFKAINDLHGHQVGDECLRRFANALRESFRPDDAIIRHGGDEFLVVAGGIEASLIADRLDRLRDRLRDTSAFGPLITFSVGIAELEAGDRPESAVQAADEAMYRAKSAGKDERSARGVLRAAN
jgi:diguanylate cyclase (GGDEF)-like protein